MHPSLAPHLHGDCLEIIEQLHRCHEQHPVGKFLGECNDIKRALNRCLKEETKMKNASVPKISEFAPIDGFKKKKKKPRRRKKKKKDTKRFVFSKTGINTRICQRS
ncbi:unnamed protein product [Porites lobata]|uniref:COX assembly mitochondrial protein n=1 Tax=Porites lobata TaxID=104759 RepID=A0ABN8S319_9CNID|nr:unnamed protein product [Porites lobata]